MTRRFLHLMSRLLGAPALAVGAAMLLTLPTSAQQPPSPPEPPKPQEAGSDSSKASERDSSNENRSTESNRTGSAESGRSESSRSDAGDTSRSTSGRSTTARDSARSGRDQSRDDRSGARSGTSRDDRSSSRDDRSSSRDDRSSSSRDADRSERDRSADESDSDDDRSASRRTDSSRDRGRETDRDDRDRSFDRDDSRSFSRDADDDRFRDRDDDSEDRFSSRDRSSFRDDDFDRERDDRFSSRDRDDRSSARDRLRDDVRETARDVRDTVRDARDSARETVRDASSTARSVRDSVSRSSRESSQEFDVETVRAADIGIWFNRSTSNGLVISDVATSGPIARLGFREGDRIVSVDGYRVNSERQFVQDLFYDDIRYERVPVVVYRNGAQRTVYVEPATLVEHYTSSQNDPLEKFGLVLDDRYTDRVVVWKTIPRTPAYYAGVRKGDVITTWDNTRVTRPDQLTQLVEQAEESGDNEVRLTVYRGQQPRQIEVEFPQVATRVERRTSYRPALEQEGATVTEAYPAVEGTRAGVIDRPRILPRPGILPRNR